jgi:hypothetical protein
LRSCGQGTLGLSPFLRFSPANYYLLLRKTKKNSVEYEVEYFVLFLKTSILGRDKQKKDMNKIELLNKLISPDKIEVASSNKRYFVGILSGVREVNKQKKEIATQEIFDIDTLRDLASLSKMIKEDLDDTASYFEQKGI